MKKDNKIRPTIQELTAAINQMQTAINNLDQASSTPESAKFGEIGLSSNYIRADKLLETILKSLKNPEASQYLETLEKKRVVRGVG